MFCIKCGTQIVEGPGFCQKCGTPVQGNVTLNTKIANATQDSVSGNLYPNLSNKWAWLLAVIPNIIAFLQLSSYYIYMFVGIMSFISFAAIFVFLIMDKKELGKNGIIHNSWWWSGFFLLPAYLFIRASKVNKYGYAIIGIILYFLVFIWFLAFLTGIYH